MPGKNQKEETISCDSLSDAEQKVVFLMRSLANQYERIEIRLNENGGISIVTTATTKETFKETNK